MKEKWLEYFTAVLLLLCLCGCQTNPSPQQARAEAPTATAAAPAETQLDRQLLVTFRQQDHADALPFGPRRAYRGRGLWSASLHVRAHIDEVAEKYGLEQMDGWPIASLNLYCVVFNLPVERDMSQLIAKLNEDTHVSFAQPMYQFQGMLMQKYDDPLFDVQYGQYKTLVEQLHTLTRGENVRIGVVDSVVDIEHPDLKGQIDNIYDFINTANEKTVNKVHGTAIAGVIAATANNSEGMVGLAPGANLSIYGACQEVDSQTRCTSFSLAKAIEQAIEDRVNILNLSLAGPYDPLLKALLDKALEQSMIVIAAENINNTTMNFPASLENVYAVGSVDTEAFWFSRNEQLSTQAGGGYRFFQGSSIATAGVTGVAALIYSLEPTVASVNDVLTKLVNGKCITFPRPSERVLVKNLQENNCGAH